MSETTYLVIQSRIQRGENLSLAGNSDGSIRASGPSIVLRPRETKSVELRTVQFDQLFLDTLATYVDRGKASAWIDSLGAITVLTASDIRELRRRDLTDVVGGVPAHALVGAAHVATGLTPGDVLTALTPTSFGFQPPSLLQDLPFMSAGRNSSITNSYLRGAGGVPTNIGGFLLPFNATIMAISATTNGTFSWTAEVRKNGGASPITSLNVVGASSGYTGLFLNISVSAGETIQMYCNGTNINRPSMLVFYKRR